MGLWSDADSHRHQVESDLAVDVQCWSSIEWQDLADYSLVKNIIWSMKIQWNKKSLHHLLLCSWLHPGGSAGVHQCPIMHQQTSSKPPTLHLLPESCHRFIPIPFTNVTEAKPFLKFAFKRFGALRNSGFSGFTPPANIKWWKKRVGWYYEQLALCSPARRGSCNISSTTITLTASAVVVEWRP